MGIVPVSLALTVVDKAVWRPNASSCMVTLTGISSKTNNQETVGTVWSTETTNQFNEEVVE